MPDVKIEAGSESRDPIGPLIVALDVSSAAEAIGIADRLDPARCRVKVGKQLFTREGPSLVTALHDRGFQVFLDLKFHDIPNTVAQAVAAAADLGVWMVNVHASGGSRMMQAAQAVLADREQAPILIAVTVLTSMSASDLIELGDTRTPEERVLSLAKLTADSGLRGVVCSAQEAPAIRAALGNDFLLVTPGIRLPGDAAGDQRRVMTPVSAIANGANYLVMGRSITCAVDTDQAISETLSSLASK